MLPTQSSQFEHAALKNYLLDHAYDEMFSGPGDLHRSLRAVAGALHLPARRTSCSAESRPPTSAS